MSAHAFIDDIELPDVEYSHDDTDSITDDLAPSRMTIEEISVRIDQGIVIVFEQSMSDEIKDDVSCSLLFAQLAADKKFNREKNLDEWYKFFTDVLNNIAWTAGAFTFQAATKELPIDWEQYLPSLVDGEARRLSAIGIGACRKLSRTSPAFKIWAKSAIGVANCQFMVAACQASSGSPLLTLTTANFGNNPLTWAFFEQNAPTRISDVVTQYQLNESLYSKIRQSIVDKLGDRIKKLIVEVPMAG